MAQLKQNNSGYFFSTKQCFELFKSLFTTVFIQAKLNKRMFVYPLLSLFLVFGIALTCALTIDKAQLAGLMAGEEGASLPLSLVIGVYTAFVLSGIVQLMNSLDWILHWHGEKDSYKNLAKVTLTKLPSLMLWYSLCSFMIFSGSLFQGFAILFWILTIFVEPLMAFKRNHLLDLIVLSGKISLREWRLVLFTSSVYFSVITLISFLIEVTAAIPAPIGSLVTFVLLSSCFVGLLAFKCAWKVAVLMAIEHQNTSFFEKPIKIEQNEGSIIVRAF